MKSEFGLKVKIMEFFVKLMDFLSNITKEIVFFYYCLHRLKLIVMAETQLCARFDDTCVIVDLSLTLRGADLPDSCQHTFHSVSFILSIFISGSEFALDRSES